MLSSISDILFIFSPSYQTKSSSKESADSLPIEYQEKKEILILKPQLKTFSLEITKQAILKSNSTYQLIINGGFFEKDGRPSGLLFIKKEEMSPFSENKILSGIIYFQKNQCYIVKKEEFKKEILKTIDFALQNGPLIIESGGKPGIKRDDQKEAERVVLACTKKHELMIIFIKKPISLYKLQEQLLISDIDAALNLDGGPSAAIKILTPNFSFTHSPLGAPAYFLHFYTQE